ncbi:hypothetical protein LTR85_003777 [Meristemomyces frigidus]|nr:hypothetical protein LTR85_003777 [Meristemomyces frigidus]
MCLVVSTDTDYRGCRTLLGGTFLDTPPATEPTTEDWESPPPRYSEAQEKGDSTLLRNDADPPGGGHADGAPVTLKMDLCRIHKISATIFKLGKTKKTKHDLLLLIRA